MLKLYDQRGQISEEFFFFPGGFSPEEGILGNEENLIKSCNGLRDTDEDEKMQANLTGVMCTLLPQCAEAPIQQSQDKADDYGLNRQQQGCLQKGRDIIVINCNGTYFGWFIIRSLSQFSTPVTSIYTNLSHTRLSVCHCQFTHTDTKELDLYGLINPQLCVRCVLCLVQS